jgi:hypothetical protein
MTVGDEPADQLEVAFTLTPEEFAEGYRRVVFRSLAVRVAWLLGGLVVVLGLLQAASGKGVFSGLLFAAALVMFGVYLVVVAPRRQFRGSRRGAIQESYGFSERGVSSRVGDTEVRQEWSYYREMFETPHLYILYGRASVAVLPKRAVPAGREEELRDLLRRHLEERAAKTS